MSNDRLNIYAVRHGLTEYNEQGRFCGWVDADLCAAGVAELTALASEHPFPKVEWVVSSPLKRCVQTANIAFPGMSIELMEDVKEYGFGDMELSLAPETLSLPGVFKRWTEHDDTLRFKNGESMGECRERGVRGFREIIKRAVEAGYSDIAVVSHGLVLALIFDELLSKPMSSEDAMVPNGMGYSFYVNKSEAFCERPLHYFGHVPEGAPRPSTAQSPYVKGRE